MLGRPLLEQDNQDVRLLRDLWLRQVGKVDRVPREARSGEGKVMVEPETVKLLAYLEETDFICIIAHAVQLHSLKVPGNYREHLAKAIRVESSPG